MDQQTDLQIAQSLKSLEDVVRKASEKARGVLGDAEKLREEVAATADRCLEEITKRQRAIEQSLVVARAAERAAAETDRLHSAVAETANDLTRVANSVLTALAEAGGAERLEALRQQYEALRASLTETTEALRAQEGRIEELRAEGERILETIRREQREIADRFPREAISRQAEAEKVLETFRKEQQPVLAALQEVAKQCHDEREVLEHTVRDGRRELRDLISEFEKDQKAILAAATVVVPVLTALVTLAVQWFR